MELVSRMMDGSILSRGEDSPSGAWTSSIRFGQERKIRYLQRVSVLEGCTDRQLRAIARITAVLDAPPGRVLTRAGEAGTMFFFIVDGSARIDVAERRHQMGPGDFFGEMSLLDGKPRSATVTAATAVRLLTINRNHFWRLLREAPDLTERVLITLSQRVRRAEKSHV